MTATYYVNDAVTDNGYGAGSDVNNGTAKGTPFLTVKKGLDTAANGDTVIVNGGAGAGKTYALAATYSGSTWWSLIPDPAGGSVTLTDATNGDTRLVTLGVVSGEYTLGALGGPALIFDATGHQTWCLATSNSQVLTAVNLRNVTFANWVGEAAELDQITTCVVDSCTVAASASATASFVGIDLHGRTQAATLSYTVRNCTFDLGTLAVNGSCLQYQGTDGATVHISNNAFTMNVAGGRSVIGVNNPAGSTLALTGNAFHGTLTGSGNTWRGLRHTGGVLALTAEANTFTVNSTDGNTAIGLDTETSGAVVVGGAAASQGNVWTVTANGPLTAAANIGAFAQLGLALSGTSPKTWVQHNVVSNPVGVSGGYTSIAIIVGSNQSGSNPSNANSLTNVRIQNNAVSGANHGILVGHVAGVALVNGNLITNTLLGIVFKDTTGSAEAVNLACGNVIIATVSGHEALVGRGAQYDRFLNNTIILPTGVDGTQTAFKTYDDPGAQGPARGVIYANNLVAIASGVTATKIVDVGNVGDAVADTGSTAVYTHNNYAGLLSATAFKYQAEARYSLATWRPAHEKTATALDPIFVGAASGDYRVPSNSRLYRAGAYVGPTAVDYRQFPFALTPTIGAFEVKPTEGIPVGGLPTTPPPPTRTGTTLVQS